MSTLKSNVIEPATGTNLSLGASGDFIDVTSDILQLNTWKDSGGNTLFTSDGAGTLSSINSALDIGGGPNLILSQTASASSSISFTSDIDSTYDKYMFVFTNINPATDGGFLQFQASSAVNVTSTYFSANHGEGGAGGSLDYNASYDRAQSTSYAYLSEDIGSDADQSFSGKLHVFNPSSTTYVKQWFARGNCVSKNNYSKDSFTSGYFNVTTAITAFDFKMDTGNFDGTIKMYGCR